MLTWLVENWVEVLGFGTGLACVYLAARRNVWNFPIALANNVVFLWLFVDSGLYAAAGLQVVYGILAIHGWVRWSRLQEREYTYVARTPRTHIQWLVIAFVVMAAGIAWMLANFTDSSVVGADASITSASLVAQYLLNRKRVESWLVWMAVDVTFAALAFASGLWITGVLYVIFFGLAFYGWRSWLAVERRNNAARDLALADA